MRYTKLNICCAMVFAFASSSTFAQEVGVPLDLPPPLEDAAPSPDDVRADADKITSQEKTKRKPIAQPVPIFKATESRPVDADQSLDAETPPKGVVGSTLIPGFIGFALGAALPTIMLAAGISGLLLLASRPPTMGPDAYEVFAIAGSLVLGLFAFGPLSAAGSVTGVAIGSGLNDRGLGPAAAGAAAGLAFGGAAFVSLVVLSAAELHPWAVTVVPLTFLVLAGPVSLAVSTLVDFAIASVPAPTPTTTSARPRALGVLIYNKNIATENNVIMPLRY